MNESVFTPARILAWFLTAGSPPREGIPLYVFHSDGTERRFSSAGWARAFITPEWTRTFRTEA